MNILFKKDKVISIILALCSCLFVGCSQLAIESLPSENYNERIRFLVIHFTTIDYQDSVRALTKGGVSAHYLMPEQGDPSYPESKIKTFQLVDESKRAWHAGRSHWQGQNNLNDQSIGIELVYQSTCTKKQIQSDGNEIAMRSQQAHDGLNIEAKSDRICFYPDFDPQQIEQLTLLIKDILKRNPEITPDRIIGHADITPNRRVDPGPKFPWQQLFKSGIGAWYEQETVSKYWQKFHTEQPSIQLIQSALKQYGYGILESSVMDAQTINALTVFQMHFRPWQVDGRATPETVATLFALIEKYRESRLQGLLDQFEQESSIEVNAIDADYLGQFDGRFPKEELSTRSLVNDRKLFKSYKGQGRLNLTNVDAQSADLFINGKKLSIGKSLVANSSNTINISQFTRTGFNTFRIANIKPEGASLVVDIPFPTLIESKSNHNHLSKKKLKEVDELIEGEITDGFPGATLLVAHQGKIIKHSAYGYSNRYDRDGNLLSTPTKMTLDTLFDLASNTKMYATNYAVMKLVSEGKLDVNKTINQYIPEYRGNGRESRLVKDLLNHSAGYQPAVDFHNENNKLGRPFFSHKKTRTQQLLVEKVPFINGRNLTSIYSDVDYMLLGTLVEKLTSMPLDSYVEQTIYRPLGLTKSVFNPLDKDIDKSAIAATELQGNTRQSTIEFHDIRTDVVHGEVHDEKAYYSMQGVAGHAGLFSTAKETAILASVLMNRGGYGEHRFFDKSKLDQFLKPSHLNITMGLGWRRAGNGERSWHFGPYASPYAVGHTGWTGTVTVIDPFHDLIIVLLTNKKHTKMIPKEEDGIIYDEMVFAGDTFETGKYGSIVSLIYEALLEKD